MRKLAIVLMAALLAILITPARAQTLIAPYPDAPLCPDTGEAHNTGRFHTLWDARRGCHYDHEHGENPFRPEIAGTFPGFDLRALLGGVAIGHTNPSSPMENTHKHGGFKWQVDWDAPRGCELGFEGGRVAVDAYAIQYHALGMKSIEFETSQHSTAALLRQCKQDNPVDKGYFFVVQLQEYGQRVAPYQGTVLQYPNSPQPPYRGGFGPYFTTPCVGTGLPFCLPGISHIIDRNRNLNSIWTSKPTGSGTRPQTSRLFRLLFRTRDDYEVLDSSDLTHPFTWLKVCAGPDVILEHCRYNSSTSTIHEIAGNIPGTWDGLAGFDQDPRPGRITAEGFVNRFGFLDRACAAPGGNCYPIKMEGAFVGYYSTQLSINKVGNPTPGNTPERDIYFCHGVPCRETSPGAVPSGWIGEMN